VYIPGDANSYCLAIGPACRTLLPSKVGIRAQVDASYRLSISSVERDALGACQIEQSIRPRDCAPLAGCLRALQGANQNTCTDTLASLETFMKQEP